METGKAKMIVNTREERFVGETSGCPVRSVEPCNAVEAKEHLGTVKISK